MNRFVTLLSFIFFLSGCTTDSSITTGSIAQPRKADWRCTEGARLTVVSEGGEITVADSRGGSVSLPADPPGQRERYGNEMSAMVFAGRTASWFANDQPPVDCKR